MTKIVPKPENLATLVLAIRGEKVLLDADLAELYGVGTKVLISVRCPTPSPSKASPCFPACYVIATGVQYSVRDFIHKAAADLGDVADKIYSHDLFGQD